MYKSGVGPQDDKHLPSSDAKMGPSTGSAINASGSKYLLQQSKTGLYRQV